MFRTTIRFIVASLLVLSLSACATRAKESMKLTEKDSGTTVELSPGDTLEITLASNPTTGYQWELAEGDIAVVQQVGEPDYSPEGAAPGSGGTELFRFKALASGQTTLRLIYHRSFEPDVPPAATFEVTIAVK